MDKSWFEQVAEIVVYHRKQSGMTQQELAALAGVGKTTIFDIEHAKPSIQLQTFVKVCHALNITITLTSPLLENYHASS